MENFNFVKTISPKKHQEIRTWALCSLIIITSSLLVMGIFTVYQSFLLIRYRAQYAQMQQQNNIVCAQKNSLKEQEVVRATFEKKYQKLQRFINDPANPAAFLEKCAELMPADVRLLYLSLNDRAVTLKGQALTADAWELFLRQLDDSRLFLSVHVVSLHHEKMNAQEQPLLCFELKVIRKK